MHKMRRVALITATTALLLSGTGLASADDIYNNLDGTIDSTAEVMPLAVGGANGTTTLAVNTTGGDGKPGCNLTGSTTLTVSVNSTNSAVATVSPSSVTFTSCGSTQPLTVTPVGAGSTTVSLSQVSNSTGGTFNLAPATFTVNVTAEANHPPTVAVSGVTDGASYDIGSVPVAMCDVTDQDDGPSSFPADLSAVTGPDAADGIGQQTATCAYTDSGGLRVVTQATYNIVDPTPPAISYTLDPASPDGSDGWYKGDVTLTWTVSEPESPSSLITTGCDPVTVSSDQLPTDYTCSASSAGGDASPVTVTIKRDGTAPVVSYEPDSAVGTPGNDGWWRSDVTATFVATDATSGPATQSGTATSSGEGDDVVVSSPVFTDNAGNTAPEGAATQAFKIDKTAPHDINFVGGPTDGTSYYYGQVPAAPSCTAIDDVSGMPADGSGCVVTGDANPNSIGTHTWTATATDVAGNTAKAVTESYTVLAWTDTGFYNPVNMGGTVNTVKAGSTVPLKFNVYAGSELTDTSVVKSFTSQAVACGTLSSSTDAVEFTTTGGTSLRYDSTGGQFVQNWKTPSTAGGCYLVTMTTQDGSRLQASFMLK